MATPKLPIEPWHRFFFGKHKGERLEDVAEDDIEYLAWCEIEFGVDYSRYTKDLDIYGDGPDPQVPDEWDDLLSSAFRVDEGDRW